LLLWLKKPLLKFSGFKAAAVFMMAREGDLIRTKSGVVFDVKGLVHPPNRIIAFPRFIPSEGTGETFLIKSTVWATASSIEV
jgi:predicted nucleotidyltransferase